MTTLFKGAFRPLSTSRTSRTVFILSLAGMVGCGLLKKKDEADAGDDAAVAEVAVDAAPPPAAAPIAANVDDVARFPDEKALDNAAATIQRNGTNVREIPGVGKVVASLAKGGTVTQVASRGTAILVVFENPKDQKKLMGWVDAQSFTAAPASDAGIKVLTCIAPDVALLSDGAFCGRICAADTDCPGGQACKGAANKFTGGKLGDAVRVCTVFTPPGTRPAVVTVVDAGKPTVVPPPPPPPATPTCPAGQTFVAQDKACHQSPCKIGGCPQAQPLCVACGGTTICVPLTARNLCK